MTENGTKYYGIIKTWENRGEYSGKHDALCITLSRDNIIISTLCMNVIAVIVNKKYAKGITKCFKTRQQRFASHFQPLMFGVTFAVHSQTFG